MRATFKRWVALTAEDQVTVDLPDNLTDPDEIAEYVDVAEWLTFDRETIDSTDTGEWERVQ